MHKSIERPFHVNNLEDPCWIHDLQLIAASSAFLYSHVWYSSVFSAAIPALHVCINRALVVFPAQRNKLRPESSPSQLWFRGFAPMSETTASTSYPQEQHYHHQLRFWWHHKRKVASPVQSYCSTHVAAAIFCFNFVVMLLLLGWHACNCIARIFTQVLSFKKRNSWGKEGQ